jgi:hypothetical protein
LLRDGQVNSARSKERPVQWIEHRRLRVRQQRRAKKEIRIPEGQVAGSQRGADVLPVRVKVKLNVAARQHAVGEQQLRVKKQHKASEQPHRQCVPDPGASLSGAAHG